MAAWARPAADPDCSETLRTAGLGSEWLSVTPPEALDALVRERLQRAIDRERESLASQHDHLPGQSARLPAVAPGSKSPALAMPVLERWVYALGLITYGAQALESLAKLLWRSVSG